MSKQLIIYVTVGSVQYPHFNGPKPDDYWKSLVNLTIDNHIFGGSLVVSPYMEKDLFRETFISPHLNEGGYVTDFNKWFKADWFGKSIDYMICELHCGAAVSLPWKNLPKNQRRDDFLHALQSLLSEYDAMIEDNWDSWQPIIGIDCHNEGYQQIIYPNINDCILTASNIMDYEKTRQVFEGLNGVGYN
jgi:hypothetical protein